MHGLHHHVLRVKTIMAGFNLAVSTPTAKPPKFSLFSLILDQDMIRTVDVSHGLTMNVAQVEHCNLPTDTS